MKTEIIKVKGDWQEVVNDCRETVGKPPLNKEPSETFKRSILIAEHSPIRDISIKWIWRDIKSWVATHYVRHKWECFVKSQRNDRQDKYDRNKAPQDAPVDFTGDANCQHLIDTARKRMCHEASPETRGYMEDLKITIHEIQPEIADVMVPNCVYRAGCPEMQACGWFRRFIERHPDVDWFDIQSRYDTYNKEFYDGRNQ